MKRENYLENKNKTGIYFIRNLSNGKLYIGSTKCSFRSRYTRHFNDLKRNIHHNKHLQSSYNKYGDDSFVFEVIEICNIEDCCEREAFHILENKTYLREFGYNKASVVNYTFGSCSPENILAKSIYKKEKASLVSGLMSDERGLNKAVNLYNIKGELIKNYKSAIDLSNETGWSRALISKVLKKRQVFINKHIILFSNDVLSQDDIKKANKKYTKISVDLFDLNMNFIVNFKTVGEAADFLCCKDAEIRMCSLGYRSRIKNYITRYKKNE